MYSRIKNCWCKAGEVYVLHMAAVEDWRVGMKLWAEINKNRIQRSWTLDEEEESDRRKMLDVERAYRLIRRTKKLMIDWPYPLAEDKMFHG